MKKSTDIRKLKNLKKPVRYSIPNCVGLHLWVRSDLKKYWVFRYTYQGKRYDTSLGSFPDVTLADARKKHQKLRGLLLNGINPFDEKNSQNNEEIRRNNAIKFAKFAEAYIERMSPKWSNKIHAMQWMTTIKSYANPVIGNMSLEQITTDHILQVLTPIWITRHATAMRLRGRIERVMSAAITSGLRTKSNPAVWRGHLENLLPILKPSEKHFPAAPYKEVPLMMKQLREDHCVASLLLQFIILNASRSGEASHARRSEISQDLWIIPAERIKARSEHVVRREGVTVAAGNLQTAGLISYTRGRIKVIDRDALEARTCECYALVRDEYKRLLPGF